MLKKIWYLPDPVLDLIGLEEVGDKLTVNFSDKGGSNTLFCPACIQTLQLNMLQN